MTAKIEYHCDFCEKELTTNSLNPDHKGYCKFDKEWTNNLRESLQGPHICHTCVIGVAGHD